MHHDMPEIKLADFQIDQFKWALRNFGKQDSYRPLLGMMEELGELCHAHLKQEQAIRTNENHEEQIKDAIGDLLIYLVHYCSIRRLDLEDILTSTWAHVQNRNWRKNPATGRSTDN